MEDKSRPDRLPTVEEIAGLPRWAIVAFAARITRRARPKTSSDRPRIDKKIAERLEKYISFIESTTQAASRSPHIVDTVETATNWLSAAALQAADRQQVNALRVIECVRFALLVLVAAKQGNKSDAAANALEAALRAIRLDKERMTAEVVADLRLLREFAEANDWDDSSAVDVTKLGPLWPIGGEPAWYRRNLPISKRTTSLISEQEIIALPLNAQLAFAARCSRRVAPLLFYFQEETNHNDVAIVLRALDIGEAFARQSKPVPDIAEVRRLANELLVRANTAVAVGMGGGVSLGANTVIGTAVGVLEVVQGAAAGQNVADSVSEVVLLAQLAVTLTLSDALEQISSPTSAVTDEYHNSAIVKDYKSLLELSISRGWQPDSAVDTALLGPLWPRGTEPPWAKQGAEASAPPATLKGELTLNLPLPPIPDDPEIRDFVAKRLRDLVHGLSEAYIQLGGSGLVLKDAELHVESPVLVEAPNGGGNGGGR